MNIAIGSDHAGYEYKEILKECIGGLGHHAVDLGTAGTASCDYPDFAFAVADSVAQGKSDFGVLICGTGIGMSMAANKVPGIRAALCSEPLSARFSREHNNANVLCLGARVIGIEMARELIRAFLSGVFAGDRHSGRLKKIEEREHGAG
ncbi:MAG: ribose 5-phosphate isomerase B [Candidatus Wallbacteria bacterium]|nr:ribose 5-phosphate isomerase B [Candidatus Wallbacteria bacterium]